MAADGALPGEDADGKMNRDEGKRWRWGKAWKRRALRSSTALPTQRHLPLRTSHPAPSSIHPRPSAAPLDEGYNTVSSASLETDRRSGVFEEEHGGGTEDKVEQKRSAWGIR
jgi:hypothetical protein